MTSLETSATSHHQHTWGLKENSITDRRNSVPDRRNMSQTKCTVFLTERKLQRQKSEPGQLKSWQSAQVGEPRGRRWDLRVGVRMDLTVMGKWGAIQMSDIPFKSVFDICPTVSTATRLHFHSYSHPLYNRTTVSSFVSGGH